MNLRNAGSLRWLIIFSEVQKANTDSFGVFSLEALPYRAGSGRR